MKLPTINNSNPQKIMEFYRKLQMHVQALETLKRLGEINGYVRMTLDRLPAIRSDLVRLDTNWRKWTFTELVVSLREWTERNPINHQQEITETKPKRDKFFSTMGKDRKCVFCDDKAHATWNCTFISGINEWRQVVRDKKLCYNCIGASHRASQCRSKKGCFYCGARHNTHHSVTSLRKDQNPLHPILYCSPHKLEPYIQLHSPR